MDSYYNLQYHLNHGCPDMQVIRQINYSNYRKKIDDQTTELEHLKKVLDSKEEMEKKQTGKKFSSQFKFVLQP